ncbi:MAG: beta-propeller fold lactonase family protein [Thermodesulfobacteriota bacterium]
MKKGHVMSGIPISSAMHPLPLPCLIAIFIALHCLAGCQPATHLSFKEALEAEGELSIYTQPFPQGTERLRFSLQSLAAVRDDGTMVPIDLAFSNFNGAGMRSQRQLGSGILPPGNYRGLAFGVKEAFLQGEEEDSALLVSDTPDMVDFPFQIAKRKATILLLVFNYAQSVRGGFSFVPGFAIFVPEKPVTGLIGYVTNSASNNITIIDKKALQVVGMIATGKGPEGIVLDRNRNRAYVALAAEDAIAVIDVSGGEVITQIRLSSGDNPRELAITPAGDLLLVVNTGSSTVSLIDPLTMFEIDRIAVDNEPRSILMDPAGKRAFVFNSMSGTISVIDIARRALATNFSVGETPEKGAFNRNGDRLYIINAVSPYLTVLDAGNLIVLQRVFVGSGMRDVMVDPRTDLLYVVRKRETAIQIYDPFALLPVSTIQTDDETAYMTIDSEENTLLLVHPQSKRIGVFGLISRKKMAEIDVGEDPCCLTLMGER